jgi:hypothetical protein
MDDATPPCCVGTRNELCRQENATVRAAVIQMLCDLLCQSVLLLSVSSVAISAIACVGASALVFVQSQNFARPKNSFWKNNFYLYGDVCRACIALRLVDVVMQSVVSIPHFSPWATTSEVVTGASVMDVLMMPVYGICYWQVMTKRLKSAVSIHHPEPPHHL